MRRTLSSPLTSLWKFAATPLLIGCSVFLLARGWSREGKNPDQAPVDGRAKVATVFFVITTGAYSLWLTMGLKRVAVDDDALFISNYRTEVRVPLTQVTEVMEGGSGRWFKIVIHLRHPTALGQRIDFRPMLRLYWSGPHPVVRELRELVDRAKTTGRQKAAVAHQAPCRSGR